MPAVPDAKVNAAKLYDNVSYAKPEISDEAWLTLEQSVKDEISWYSEYFGYSNPAV